MSNKNQQTGMQALDVALNILATVNENGNYASYTQSARVEPNMILDSTLVFNENTSTIIQSLQSSFTAYYLLAWSMYSVEINGVSISDHLRKLNPNNNVTVKDLYNTGNAIWNLANWNITKENYSYKLPNYSLEDLNNNIDKYKFETTRHDQKIRDDRKNNLDERNYKLKQLDTDIRTKTKGTSAPQQNMNDIIKEVANLSVGKIVEVKLSNGVNEVTVPILIRLLVNTMKPDLLIDFLSKGFVDNSISSRWIKYKSGQINLIDLLTAKDLVVKHKKNIIKDKSGLARELASQRRGNTLGNIFSSVGSIKNLKPSVANATNLILISHDTARKIELETGSKFDDFRFRQNLFSNTGLFILAVYDTEYERVKFYTNSIAKPSDLSIKDCKNYNKKEGDSVLDMMKAYQMGSSPGF